APSSWPAGWSSGWAQPECGRMLATRSWCECGPWRSSAHPPSRRTLVKSCAGWPSASARVGCCCCSDEAAAALLLSLLLLATVEDLLGVPRLGRAAAAEPMTPLFNG